MIFQDIQWKLCIFLWYLLVLFLLWWLTWLLYRETLRHRKRIRTQQLPQQEIIRFVKEQGAEGGGWIGVYKSADPLWFINQIRLKISPESEIRAKILLLHAKSKIRAPKLDESEIRCNCRIWKSVKISFWIRNPGKKIFKIRRSVRLFTPLLKTTVLIVGAVVLCFLPMAVYQLLKTLSSRGNKERVYGPDLMKFLTLVVHTASLLNSLVNPLIYCMLQTEKFVLRFL